MFIPIFEIWNVAECYRPCKLFISNFYLSNYSEGETKYFERVTVIESKPIPCANMLPNMDKCEHG